MVSWHFVDMFVSGQMKGINIKRNAENVEMKKTRNLTKLRIHGNQRKGTKYSKTGVSKKPKKETENEQDVNMDSKDSDNKSANQDIENKDNETPQTSHQEGSDE